MAVSENRRPPSPDGPARLVNNYLSAAAHERAAQAVLFFLPATVLIPSESGLITDWNWKFYLLAARFMAPRPALS